MQALLPVAFALAGAKADERDVLAGMLTAGPDLITTRAGQTLIGGRNYCGRALAAAIARPAITCGLSPLALELII
jgi:hypothetical protein